MQFYPVSILVVKLRLGIKSLAGKKDTTRLSWVLCMLKHHRIDITLHHSPGLRSRVSLILISSTGTRTLRQLEYT